MKKLIILIGIILICSVSFGQMIVQRSNPATTPLDPNLFTSLSFRVPVFDDTTSASAAASLDSCGKQFYNRATASMWFRACIGYSSRKWIELLPSGSPSGQTAWLLGGNPLLPRPDSAVLGSTDNEDWYLISNNQKFLKLNKGGIQANSGSVVNLGVNMSTGDLSFGSSGLSTLPISSLTAATATNGINNLNYFQNWTWNTLSGDALEISTNATTAAGGAQRLLVLTMSGANANASQLTTAFSVSNSHTGTSSTNLAATFSATGGSNNYAIIVPASSGTVGIGNSTPVALLTLGTAGSTLGSFSAAGNTSGVITFQPQAAAGTYNWNWPTTAGTSGYFLTSGGGGSTAMTWTQNNFLTGLTVGTTTIASGTTTRILYDNAGVLGEYTITGSGTVVAMQTSPSFVTSVIGGASFDAFNTISTTLNFGGAATTMTIGGTPTTAITHNYSTNATATATTKTVNVATGGAAGSTTNVNIASVIGGTTALNSPIITIGGGTTASDLRFFEGSGGGANYVGFKANATLAGNTIYTLPTAFPAGTYLLNSTNAGVMGFTDPSTLTGLPYWPLTGTGTLTGNTTIDGSGGPYNITINSSPGGLLRADGNVVTIGDPDVAQTGALMRIDAGGGTAYILSTAIAGGSNGDAITLIDNTTGELGVAPNLAFNLQKQGTEIYASNGLIFAKDKAGNKTQISPHNKNGDWVYNSTNAKGSTTEINMTDAIKTIEQLTKRVYELEKKLNVKTTKPKKLIHKK